MTFERAYLDYNATAPLRPVAREAMLAAMSVCGNASSVHREGREARAMVETAREHVARLFDVLPAEVIFTSSGTEAANMIVRANWDVIVLSGLEHAAIREPARASAAQVVEVPVQSDGVIDLEALAAQLSEHGEADRSVLVAIQAANNETGVIQPVTEAARIAQDAGAKVLCDAVQTAGRIPVARDALGADFLVVSAHKIGGPQGVGALIVRDGIPLSPLIIGGGQEKRRRGGTENVAAIAGFGAAAKEAEAQLPAFAALESLRDRLEDELCRMTPSAVIVGRDSPRLANTSAIALPGRKAETMVIALDMAGVAISAGAACSSGKVGKSHVLEAMGLSNELAVATVRISLGYASAKTDIEKLTTAWQGFADRAGDTRHVA